MNGLPKKKVVGVYNMYNLSENPNMVLEKKYRSCLVSKFSSNLKNVRSDRHK